MESCKKCKREFTPLRKKFICPDCSDEVCSECCSPPHFIANRRVCASCFNVHSQLYGEQRKIKGHDAYKKKNWKSAFALYDGVQDKIMDPIVCVRLGIMLRRGEGIAQDIEKANILIQTALPLLRARPENIHCIYYLGVLHENGFGMPKNPREAFNYYKMASDQGDSNSQYNIGFMYQYGSEDIPQDYVNAFKYYKLSANREHPDAQFKLGYMYRYGYGVEKDEDKAFKYYMLAGQQGDASAICNIGYMYQSGLGVDVDNVKALLYYKKAAEKRCISAYSSIGYMFEMGLGTTKNYDEAFKNYKIGSDLGCRSAHAFLGQLYEVGLGVAEDIAQAKHYYSLAAAKGDTFASEKLNYLSSLDGNENRDNTESAYEKK